jgi:D-serine deaminase-like pyridoxal phosphate-dependent protein
MRALPASLADLQTPCLLVDLAAVSDNLAAMRRHLGGDLARWRPHVKTSKIPAVLDLVYAAGVRQFKCATTREAAVLLAQCAEPIDLLVAMAHYGANLTRVRALAREFPRHRLSLLTEDPQHAAQVRTLAPELGLFVDLDPAYGRTGIPLDEPARIAATLAACGQALRGLHCYEGHLRGDSASRAAGCAAIYAQLSAVADRAGAALEVITSGTPAFPFALCDSNLQRHRHRVSAGTVVYWDATSEAFAIAGFRPAVTVLATVISAPRAGHVTCDAGSKALDAACGDPCAYALGWPHLTARTPSEEHLPLARSSDGPMPVPGTRLRLVPRHVCPTVNLADDAVLLEGERITAIAAVSARGHEVCAD